MIAQSILVHSGNWSKWLEPLKGKPAMGLELGTWLGESAEWMMDNIFTDPLSTYTCVDHFQGSEEHRLAGEDLSHIEDDCREKLRRFPHCTIRKLYTDNFLKLEILTERRYDFIYVDASHDAMNVLRDSVLAFELLKSGGFMLWDDYTWKVMPDAVDCPRMGIDGFTDSYARHIEVVGLGEQMCVRKL